MGRPRRGEASQPSALAGSPGALAGGVGAGLGFTGPPRPSGRRPEREELVIQFGLSLKVLSAGLLKILQALEVGWGGARTVTPTESKQFIDLEEGVGKR